MGRVIFQIADGQVGVIESDKDAQALAAELAALGGDWCRQIADQIVAASGDGELVVTLDEANEAHAVTRAPDHLRNAAKPGWDEEEDAEALRFDRPM